MCLLIDGVTHQAEFDLRDIYSPKVVDEIAQGSVNRPILEITATTTEASGLLQVRNLADTVPITHFYSWTLPPGLPPRWAQTHLELFAAKVIPAFR